MGRRLPTRRGGSGSCGPWSLGIGSANYTSYAPTEFTNAKPSLVHTADLDSTNPDNEKTLKFAADVLARHGALATMVPPASRSRRWRLPEATNKVTTACSPRSWVSIAGFRSRAISGTRSGRRSAIGHRLVGVPICGSAATDAQALDPRSTRSRTTQVLLCGRLSGRPSRRSWRLRAAALQLEVLVESPPGAYGKAQTTALNDLLGGTCPNRTFWFRSASASASASTGSTSTTRQSPTAQLRIETCGTALSSATPLFG